MIFRQLFDYETWTFTYLLADEQTKRALLIDTVLDQVERDVRLLEELGLSLAAVVDTHVHADHLSGSGRLRSYLGAEVILSERSGSAAADRYVKHGDLIEIDGFALEVRETPGHTDGCISLVAARPVPEAFVFTGDALLIRGCGRTDFQGGDARILYRSLHANIFTLPDTTIVFPAHDYRGHGMSTVGEERRFNPRLGDGKSEDDFVAIMDGLSLARPAKIDVAVPANLFAGVPPERDMAGLPRVERGWAPIERSAGGVPEVPPEWVLEHRGGARLIDVRELDELDGELRRLEGAEHVVYSKVLEAAEAWPRDKPIVFVCRSGGRSGRTAVALEQRGFQRVASVRGGMRAVVASRLPSE